MMYNKTMNMKWVGIGILLSLISLIACADRSGYTVTIQGEIEGIKYGKAYLSTLGENNSILLSTPIENGKFTLKGALPEKGRYLLNVNRKTIFLFLDGENIQVKASYNQLDNSDIKGSEANDLELEYSQLVKEKYQKEFGKLQADYREILQQGDQKTADDKMSEILQLGERRYLLAKEFIKKHPDNIFSIHIANMETQGRYEKGKELYDLLSPAMKRTTQGKELKQRVDELANSALGVPCPGIQAETEQGELITIDSLKGHFVVLDFWASWCGPCRQEMKNLKTLHEEFASQGVSFVSISFDDSTEKWKKACEEEQIPWMSLLDKKGWKNSEIRQALGIQQIPFIVLLDREGNIVAKNIRRNLLRDKLVEVIK